jgi:hypothetical protein
MISESHIQCLLYFLDKCKTSVNKIIFGKENKIRIQQTKSVILINSVNNN